MKFTATRIVITAVFALVALTDASPAAIKVTRKPAKVEYRPFDPQNKPADMPPMNHGEIAFCKGDYGVAVKLAYTPSVRKQANGKYLARVVVADVFVELELINQIWIPNNASDKLKAHEEGHRQIAEMVYDKIAEKAARQAADKLDGRKFEGEGATSKEASEAADAAMAKAHSAMIQAYLDQTSRAGQKTQELYDEITAHGARGEVAEADAIAKAFTDRPPPLWVGNPATRPATLPATKPATKPVLRTTK
ncbi:hypothetical protein [Humisphaera borealis]|uniref:DUF922 domain-containing protein n=1 Tax=Humisphaera borealis TaxID=2807512 RepID=A0A7M2WPK3_9BACT|nr:hypothetical protein [Humisphaera borealis]QOV87457.1 hypothetical protein IPV69_14285 [Humisphaera borealis]